MRKPSPRRTLPALLAVALIAGPGAGSSSAAAERRTDPKRNGALAKLCVDRFTLCGREFFRIVQVFGERFVPVQNARRGNDRAGKAAAADLIDTGDKAKALALCLILKIVTDRPNRFGCGKMKIVHAENSIP